MRLITLRTNADIRKSTNIRTYVEDVQKYTEQRYAKRGCSMTRNNSYNNTTSTASSDKQLTLQTTGPLSGIIKG